MSIGIGVLAGIVFLWFVRLIIGGIFGSAADRHGKTFCPDAQCNASRRNLPTKRKQETTQGGHETNQAILSASKSIAKEVTQDKKYPIIRDTSTGSTTNLEHEYSNATITNYSPGKAEMGFDQSTAIQPAGNAVGLQSARDPLLLQDYNAELVTLSNGTQVVVNVRHNGGKA